MIWLKHLIATFSLVIASAGAIPLWLHHHFCHLECSSNHSVCHSHVEHGSCNHHPVKSIPVTEVLVRDVGQPSLLQLESAHHDCQICFQLSQLAVRQLVSDTGFRKTIHIEPTRSILQVFQKFADSSNSSRGPPAA